MFPLLVILYFLALAIAIASSGGRLPLWPAVFVLALAALIQLWPQ